MLDFVENSTRTYVLWKLKVRQILTAQLHKLPSSLGDFFLHKSSSKNNSYKDDFWTKLEWINQYASNFLNIFALWKQRCIIYFNTVPR